MKNLLDRRRRRHVVDKKEDARYAHRAGALECVFIANVDVNTTRDGWMSKRNKDSINVHGEWLNKDSK